MTRKAIAAYANNMKDGRARARMASVRKHLDDTCFGWIGSSEPKGDHYGKDLWCQHYQQHKH